MHAQFSKTKCLAESYKKPKFNCGQPNKYNQLATFCMKQLLIFFLFSLPPTVAAGQEIMDYYRHINRGKLLAIEMNWSAAIDAYQAAFESYKYPFARDCFNAVELAVLDKDTVGLKQFLAKAFIRGIRSSDLESAGIINDYMDREFYQIAKAAEDSLQHIYNSTINIQLRDEIIQMFEDDQKLRDLYYEANVLRKVKVKRKWRELNSRQVERLVDITVQHGFPGEKLIGFDRSEMHAKIMTSNYSAGIPIVILIHHFSQPNESIDSLLEREVKLGNLYNEHFATICDFEAKFGKNKFPNYGYYGLRHKPKKLNKSRLNVKRTVIGLLKVDEVEKLNKIQRVTKFWNRLY
jgi:hypothetical protein